ncbi:efflux RND transporter periplasmic adaptor subunit [Brevibacillus sp. H7]|uniref:efflux RND transporter periplasmic adaptor subunit n=1 Tax=Brevibacillus sp. H7 TaxID=3349138 RepID=UPI00380FE742
MVKKRFSLILAATLFMAAGCGSNPSATEAVPEAKTKVVEVYKVQKQTKPIMLSVTGIVEAKQDAVLSFGTSGRITSINVKKGDVVSKGSLLASLDSGYYQKAVDAAAGQVQEAYARKSKTVKGATPEAIQQQRLQVESASKRLTEAVRELEQAEKLYAGGAISKSELDSRRSQKEQAEITVKNEQIRLNDLLKGAEPEDIVAVDASVKQAATEVERAKKNLNETKIAAPFAGTVVDVTQQAGELSGPGQPVIHLVDLSEVKVTVDVASDLIDQFTVGKEVFVSKEGANKTTGKATFISPVINPNTGKYRVEITVSNPEKSWRGGMLAQVEVPRQIHGLVVPLESIGISQSDRYVLVVKDGVAKKQMVKVGQVMDDQIEVLSGIQAGDQVIRAGITYVVDGEKVTAKGE